MAVVYLPYGYPKQSGVEFQTVVYQGTIVRVYTLPTDPRTTDQLFNRRFLADSSKMRSTIGTWAKQLAKQTFGSKWSTAIYQLLKADDAGYWADAEALWNTFPQYEQIAWRTVAPYQATYNDPGKVFFCYARALVQILEQFTGLTWKANIWGLGDSAAALTWWNKAVNSELFSGFYDETSSLYTYVGGWQTNGWAVAIGGATKDTNLASGCSVEFYFFGSAISFYFVRASSYYTGEVFLDGVSQGTLDQHTTGSAVSAYQSYFPAVAGLHHFKIELVTTRINIDGAQPG